MKHRHEYSQHFLKDPMLVKGLLKLTPLSVDDVVCDLGAGSGIMSAALALRCKEVIAVEYEAATYRALERNMKRFDNVQLVQGDVLRFAPPQGEYSVFANIPFHISADIVRRFTREVAPASALYIIVQRQFAQKLECKDAHFTSTLGAQLAPFYQVRQLRQLKQSDFLPEPRVDTMFIEIKRRTKPFVPVEQQAEYCEFVQKCYNESSYFTALKPKVGIPSDTSAAKMTVTQWLMVWGSKE